MTDKLKHFLCGVGTVLDVQGDSVSRDLENTIRGNGMAEDMQKIAGDMWKFVSAGAEGPSDSEEE